MTEIPIQSLPWQPIETAPRVDMAKYIGYDKHAEDWGSPEDGLCLITWIAEDDDDPAMWQVQPFSEGLDVVFDEQTNVTHWLPLSALLAGVEPTPKVRAVVSADTAERSGG